METAQLKIEKLIFGDRDVNLIFPSEFRGLASDDSIKQALSRLTQRGKIKRLAKGIYYLPETDKVLGEFRPSIDEVIQRIAQKERIRIKPAGSFAFHELGLTTQVPTRRLYLTDGHSRKFKIGNLEIKFRPTTPKKLSHKGKISGLAIQALEELGTTEIDEVTEKKLKVLLQKEEPEILMHDLQLTTGKVNTYILNLLKNQI